MVAPWLLKHKSRNLEGGGGGVSLDKLKEANARFFFTRQRILFVHFFKHRVSSAGMSTKFNRGEKLDAREVYRRGEEFFFGEKLKNIFLRLISFRGRVYPCIGFIWNQIEIGRLISKENLISAIARVNK